MLSDVVFVSIWCKKQMCGQLLFPGVVRVRAVLLSAVSDNLILLSLILGLCTVLYLSWVALAQENYLSLTICVPVVSLAAFGAAAKCF